MLKRILGLLGWLGVALVFAAGNEGPAEDTVIEPQKLLDDIVTELLAAPGARPECVRCWAPMPRHSARFSITHSPRPPG